jgi:hypothetical protein
MCPLTNGEHAVFEEGKVTIVPDITMKMFTLTDFLMTSKNGTVRLLSQRNSSAT